MIWNSPNSLFYTWIYSCPTTICWKYFSLLTHLCMLVKNQWIINVRVYFWASSIYILLTFKNSLFFCDYSLYILFLYHGTIIFLRILMIVFKAFISVLFCSFFFPCVSPLIHGTVLEVKRLEFLLSAVIIHLSPSFFLSVYKGLKLFDLKRSACLLYLCPLRESIGLLWLLKSFWWYWVKYTYL